MVNNRRVLISALLALGASASFASHSIAPPSFFDDLQQTRQDDRHMALAVWLSPEMYRRAIEAHLPPADARRLLDALGGYAVFAIADATLDPGSPDFHSKDHVELRSSARLQLGARAPRAVLREADQSADIRAAVRAIQPLVADLLGKVGDAMEFVVFNVADEHGKPLADPRDSLVMTLSFDSQAFVWRLPLASLLPLRVDAATGDTFPGDFDYSPFTGNKLAVAK